ncbi:hypothetical protein GCM10007387_07060 [Pseudoduganella albidiflava]|uniref:Uncharacterized protein n=1 Tax=Pseudoduganella albidiflava TaxID=321983 RepID=A0AA87XPW6_9BURK|nr:hypothetical protein GCM10007387_07060 [Pseudoduganella albidiflava]
MLYAGIAIIITGIVSALSPILREWYAHRKRKEREGRDRH